MPVGRNEPCPCGSGRKYKVCHGRVQTNWTTAPASLVPVLGQVMQLLDQGAYAQAEQFCRRLVEDHPELAEARHYLGMALCFAGRLDEGLGHIRASLLLRPRPPAEHNLAVFHNNLALWLEKTGDLDGAQTHYEQALRTKPDYRQACSNLANLLMRRDKHHLARVLLEELLRTDPQNAELRARLADTHFFLREHAAMERDYRALIARSTRPAPLLLTLGNNLLEIGRYDDACRAVQAALDQEPDNMEAIIGIARLEEARNRLDDSERWTERGLARHPDDPKLRLNLARLRRRQGRMDEALEQLAVAATGKLSEGDTIQIARERGMILDKQKRWDEAFEAFRQASDLQRRHLEQRIGRPFYDKTRHAAIFDSLRRVFTRERFAALAPYLPPPPDPAPIFIVGFPRSGTTLLEQMLGTQAHIHAGDELQGIPLLAGHAAQQIMRSFTSYPGCLAEASEPGKQGALTALRDFYLHIAREARAVDPQRPRFTDKMPLNEENLGLIRLIFPQSPIIHVLRHPLDVILSCYFNQPSHGDNCALSLDTLAFHYRGAWDLVEHYRTQMDLRYTSVRYEDLLADPEREMRRLFDFLGEPWEPRCLEFHKSVRVPRTASYAQVNQPLYRSSQERWRPYRKHLEPIIPGLTPLLDKLRYGVD